LPAVDRFTHPTGDLEVVVQVSVRAEAGPSVPLLTVYGGGTVVAGTRSGWRTGRITELDLQALLDDAEGVGLLDEALVLRRPNPSVAGDRDYSTPDITVSFDVDGRRLVHQLDLARIERPPSIRAFLNEITVNDRFELDAPFDPDEWIACTGESSCLVVEAQQDPTSRPVLPHEDASALVGD
jgi:hypothetical protein